MRLALLTVLLSLAAPAAAQDGGLDGGVTAAELDEMSISEFEGHDPFGHDDLGIGEADPLMTLAPDDALLAATEPTADELAAPPVGVLHGAALDAVRGVHESRHVMRVWLTRGLAIVDEEIALVTSSSHRAEVLEHVHLPSGSALVSLEVCNDAGCRSGVADPRSTDGAYDDALIVHVDAPSALPVAHAALDGGVLQLRAAPVVQDQTLTIRLRWVAPTTMHGGALRWALPPRGPDDRLAELSIDVRSDELVETGLDGRPLEGESVLRHASDVIVVTALAPRTGGTLLEASTLRCASGRRAVVRARAPRPSARPLRLVLAIDASPSTTAGARGRIVDAALVLAGSLAPGSEVLPVAFAARAETLVDAPVAPEALDARALRTATEAELGSMTSLEALAALVLAQSVRPDVVVVVGDGGLSPTDGRSAAAESLRAAGIRLSSLGVADRASSAEMVAATAATGGIALDLGPEAREASEHAATEPLAARLAPIVADDAAAAVTVRAGASAELGVLRAGEELRWSGTGTPVVRAGDASLRATELGGELAVATCALLEGTSRLVAVDAHDDPASGGACGADGTWHARRADITSGVFGGGLGRIALAHRRSCAIETATVPAVELPSGLVAPSLLRQLRRRVIPAARGCFRDDRAGRLHYETRLVVHLVLSDREVVYRSVEDAATPELEACILSAVESLDLPTFDGTIVVSWPLRTEGEPVPPTAELAPDLSTAIDRIGESTAPPLDP